MRLRVCLVVCLFQPALPMRGVTPRFQAIGDTRQFQPVHPMRGVTGFSAHDEDILLFQPALPMRGVTRLPRTMLCRYAHFNPHSPCGE